MGTPKKLIVVHRDDDGSIGFLPGVFDSVKDAAGHAGAYLWEKRELHLNLANRLAYDLMAAPVATIVNHKPAGMDFRILEADFTSDGAPIMPGMRVRVPSHDRELGTVVAGRFMTGYSPDPGGLYFNGWYDVEKDSGTVHTFNGEQLCRP